MGLANKTAKQDSSPRSGRVAIDTDRETTVVLVIKTGQCICGCGSKTNSERSQFLQGHDARLRGILLRAQLHDRPIVISSDGESVATTTTARKMAAELGWSHALEAAQGRAKVRKPRTSTTRAIKADKPSADRAAKMTLAAKVTKALGVNKNLRVTPQNYESILDATHPIIANATLALKVGRWAYEGRLAEVVSEDKVRAHYYPKNGSQKTTTISIAELQAA